jgi:hypothetical protein
MLKIHVLNSRHLLNDLHVQCVTEINHLTALHHPETLGIAVQYADFLVWYERETAAFEFIRRSQITTAKKKADRERDLAFMGLFNFVKSAINHYYMDVATAARRLMAMIDTFNRPVRLAYLSYDAKTASIQSLIDNLKTCPEEIEKLNLQGWIATLQNKNEAFEALTQQYIEKMVAKPAYNMVRARQGVENSMRTLFRCIDSLIVLQGEATRAPYVNALNAIIKHYNDVYAIHIGHYEANK